MKRLDSCKLSAGADTAETLAGILGIEQTSVFLQNKKD
ncbi:unknown [Acetobacter sp. CAG:267]|nr:unknown [Acetobacter sp. CAG:267]